MDTATEKDPKPGGMATRRKNIYLYLTLACFVGIIAIFIIDGYLGVYDTVHVQIGETERTIEPERWLRENYKPIYTVTDGGRVFFRYEIDNRQFSAYSADVKASVWLGQVKKGDLISQAITVDPFEKEEVKFGVVTNRIRPTNIPPTQNYQFSVVITSEEIERSIIVNVKR